ncbi:MAG TPA: sigma-70 family RNA polymerase sigma factor [Candidatus Paceibacterota bacterium]|mgnify:CR=1 FL=1|nr:sigma-70 family RNA polymerase sigma factor [Candidatus Paceibacterota bacterium]
MSEVTRILDSIAQGDRKAAEELLPIVYEELRRLAAQKLSREKPGQTLQATALVHEAWLRLVDESFRYSSSRQFFLVAAEAMRRILVENARRKQSLKHGGHLQRVDAAHVEIVCPLPDDQLLMVDEALDRLATANPRAAEVVKLRFFAGLTEAQVAEHQGVSVATVQRTWVFARTWLFTEIQRDQNSAAGVSGNPPKSRI